ncbi:SDR family NAD(P)-dependent oxidoreductase [Nocardia fluminea]|uniref:SDR family NAD(P)-dependent oxidoreductase n=1 Tax=Nocardia fluminea TaxID=134984 RepID=UPI0033D52CEB
MRELSGRVGVVTGAASGIGRGIAERLANEGVKLVLADVDETALNTTVAELTAAGAEAIGVVTDVSSRTSIENLAAVTMDTFGAVHVLCNNAGVETGGAFDDIPEQSWRWVIDVNLFGVVFGCQVFLPLLRAQDEVHIVNTASVAAFESSVPTMAPYTASKFAVLGATESLSYELRARGDRVGISILAPGAVRTRMADAERTRPADVPGTLDDSARKAAIGAMSHLMETNGMEANEVGGMVVEAIREDRFFILTHPQVAFDAADKRREWMRAGTVPGAFLP